MGIVHFPETCSIVRQIILKIKIVVREDIPVPEGFPNHRVQRFDRIDGADNPADFIRIVEQGYQIFPVGPPASADRRILRIPFPGETTGLHPNIFFRHRAAEFIRIFRLFSPAGNKIQGKSLRFLV